MDDKSDLRSRMRTRLREVAALDGAMARSSRRACALLREQACWKGAATLLAYLSLDAEVSCDPLISLALAEGLVVAVPRIRGDALDFCRIASASGPWSTGALGIREPPASADASGIAALPGPILAIVPGLAFDAHGARLGRGKGYYDRFLRELRLRRRDALAVGLALREQVVADVPVSSGDEPVDALCTDAGFRICMP